MGYFCSNLQLGAPVLYNFPSHFPQEVPFFVSETAVISLHWRWVYHGFEEGLMTQGIDVWNMYYTFTMKETTNLVINI